MPMDAGTPSHLGLQLNLGPTCTWKNDLNKLFT